MITDSRKLQFKKAKRRYEFKKMVSCKESKGIRYSITGDELADLFMNQADEELRVSGVVFLKGYQVVNVNDTVKGNTVDTTQLTAKKVSSADNHLLKELAPNYYLWGGVLLSNSE